jgi:prepilin-type N-terminal cleavage/methylation domain-containing protein
MNPEMFHFGVAILGRRNARRTGKRHRSVGSLIVPMPSASLNGFTLVELLVVIGVIGILMGLLLPALAAARRQAKMVNEMAASHELIQAYIGYVVEHKDHLLPGYINSAARPDLAVTDSYGNALNSLEIERWPWRLMAYLHYNLKGTILVNDMAELANRDHFNSSRYLNTDWAYAVSLFPSFGLNFLNVGGNLNSPARNQQGWIMKITQARRPSRLIVFASSHHSKAIGGFFEIDSPVAVPWADVRNYSPLIEPYAWGYVAPRWDGKAVVACLDGHSEALSLREMCDMTRWSNAAAIAGKPNWGRTAGDPNWVP